MRQRTQTFALHCAPLSFQRVTLTTRGRTVHQQLCLLQCLLFCLFCLIHFIIFLHPLSKHLLRPQHMNLCLGKHSTFLSCNTICVASSHFCVFDHCFEKKTAKAVFPTAPIFLAASSGEMLHYTSLRSVERKFLVLMIQQKNETL